METRFFWLVTIAIFALTGRGDEGLWLYEKAPKAELKSAYGFEPSERWWQALRDSTVKLNNGSASFVSSTGLILTNQHVASQTLDEAGKLSGKDFVRNGFYAATQAEEIPAPTLIAEVVVSVEDVTARVKSAYSSDASFSEIDAAVKKVSADIEKECLNQTGLRGRVVKLYQGAAFSLYRMKQYTDLRIVFAPEVSMGDYGGDVDNFEFPRHDLDIAVVRAYENGRPVALPAGKFFPLAATPVKQGDLVFISGSPGTTSRLLTANALRFARDFSVPGQLRQMQNGEALLSQFGRRSEANQTAIESELHAFANWRKHDWGQLRVLQNPQLFAEKDAEDKRLQKAANENPALHAYRGAWKQIDDSLAIHRKIYRRHAFLERGWAFYSQLFKYARTLVRLATEDLLPNEKRLLEFRDTNRPELLKSLLADVPVNLELETTKLTASLSEYVTTFGADDSLTFRILQGKSPAARVMELVTQTKIGSVDERLRLSSANTLEEKQRRLAALRESQDPMIRLAFTVDKSARKYRAILESSVQTPQNQAYAQIAAVRRVVDGDRGYPDATSSLRFSFGKVFDETTVGSLFEREAEHNGREPFALPDRWKSAKPRLNMATSFNFTTDNDSISGNSGSPVLNRDGELVGIYFDTDLGAFGGIAYQYSPAHRGISVSVDAMLHSLREVYGAAALADELGK